nr:hypothetical protein [Tanacetum cinerariifolium]
MRDEHLDTISATESDEFIKSSIKNIVPIPSESEGESDCDVPAREEFTTFSNILFDAEYEFNSSDDRSFSDEDLPKEIYSNPLDDEPFSDEDILKEIYSNPIFNEETISMKIDPHHFNADSDLIESLLNHDSSIISSSSKIDYLLDEFAAITITLDLPTEEPKDSLRMRDEHIGTIPAIESDEFIKSSVENLFLNPSESEDLSDSECDVPACDDFTTFSNILFDAKDDFSSSDDEPFSDEDISKEIYSNPIFDEETISMKIDPHHFNADSDLIESLLNHDSSIISSSSKIDYLLDEFAGKIILLKTIPLGIDETDCDPDEEIRLIKKLLYDNSSPHIRLIEKLLYDNSSPRLPEEFVSANSEAASKSFSPSPILVRDSDSLIEEIDLLCTLDYPMPSGIMDKDYDSERDILITKDLPSNNTLSFAKKKVIPF